MSTNRPSCLARRAAAVAALAIGAAPLATLISSPTATAAPTAACTFKGMVASCGTYETAAACENARAALGGRVEWPTAPGYTPAQIRLECHQFPTQWELLGSIAG